MTPGTKLLGEVITWNASGISIRHLGLIEALRDAGLDESIARELAPRHAFSRACKRLSEARIIRHVSEDANSITFQFTRESRATDGYEYTLEARLSLEKATGKVTCDLPGLATLAQEELDRCVAARTGSDVTRVIQRLFERQADLFPVPSNGPLVLRPRDELAAIVGVLVAPLDTEVTGLEFRDDLREETDLEVPAVTDYTQTPPIVHVLGVSFSGSVAPIELVEKPARGVQLFRSGWINVRSKMLPSLAIRIAPVAGSKFARRFNGESGVQSCAQKYFDSVFRKFVVSSRRPVPPRGALRDRHECWARDAMDVGGVVRRATPTRTVKACGPGAPGLVPSARGDDPRERR